MVVHLAEKIKVKNNLSEKQIDLIANHIIKYHDTLTLEDIWLCFERMSAGCTSMRATTSCVFS
jgi:hypothetical protein